MFLFTLSVDRVSAVTQDEIDQTLTNLETQRIQKLETELGLTIPDISDNPTHTITFKDPSGNTGVKLEIDGQGFKTIVSPYTLPSLGIGKHTIIFKFTDSEETPQILEEILTIIPRPPIIDAPEKLGATELTFKGTALAGSVVDLNLTSGTKNYKGAPEVKSDGTWSYNFKGVFQYGIYSIIGVTRKNGYASNYSETTVFELSKTGEGTQKIETLSPVSFAFKDLLKQDPVEVVKENPDLAITAAGFLILGIVFGLLLSRMNSSAKEMKIEGILVNTLNRKEKKEKNEDKKVESKGMTLREKFEKAGLSTAKTKDDTQVKSTEVKADEKEKDNVAKETEKTVTKEEFLKEYKEADPDDTKGKEKEEKKVEQKSEKLDTVKNIEVSLTSKPRK
ncbi:MAG: Major sperm protein [candidate division WS6 bacterium GW2011_GWF2_39_15]|uniref:Major sperm protein n=1 Tax=candidate division WS6 bacterium GW2011_GWF2_39_15 TaxID=1619100 RepID=A0A0G0MQ50_9BACT|nr:MAG: Major sperm protein [candidate division WS6 bacterium GW2011_GWF2_39_15]